MNVLLIRHGHPDYEHDCLTELGHAQARALSERLCAEPITSIFSSPLGRAKETAAYTADALGLPVEILPFMREICWGKDGFDPSFHPWHLAVGLAKEGIDLLTYDYAADPKWGKTTFEKSVLEVSRGFDEWIADHGYRRKGTGYLCEGDEKETVAIFAHAGAISVLLSHLLGLPWGYPFHTFLCDLTSVTAIRISAKPGELAVPTVLYLNDHLHTRGIETAPAAPSRGENE